MILFRGRHAIRTYNYYVGMILRSQLTNKRIIVSRQSQKEHLIKIAKEHNLTIIEPLIIEELEE